MAFWAAAAPYLANAAVTIGSTLPLYMGAGQPSEEEQERMLRRQLEIQDEFEQQKMGRMGAQGGGDLAGLVGMQQENPMSLASLMADERETASLGRIARNMRQSRFAGMNPELEELLAGSTARLAAMQSERTLAPIEVLQMLEALNG
jgi:hypothetical protein